jgi:F0F1-type ATP synthase assembly protein I
VDVSQRRELNKGLGDGFSRPFEFILAPTLFGFLGYRLDLWLGTSPAFLVVLALLAVVAVGVKFYYEYTAEMAQHEEARR